MYLFIIFQEFSSSITGRIKSCKTWPRFLYFSGQFFFLFILKSVFCFVVVILDCCFMVWYPFCVCVCWLCWCFLCWIFLLFLCWKIVMMIVDIFLLLFLVSSSFGVCCRLVWVLGIRVLWCYFVLCVIVLFICGYFRCTYARIVQGKTLLRKALKIRFFYGQYLWIPRNYYRFDKMRKHKTTKI